MADDLRVKADGESGQIESIIERYNERPDQCTIFDPQGHDTNGYSAWITAKEGSYVDLNFCR